MLKGQTPDGILGQLVGGTQVARRYNALDEFKCGASFVKVKEFRWISRPTTVKWHVYAIVLPWDYWWQPPA